MIKHIKNCQRITELSSLSAEKPLTPYQAMEMKLHLMWCPMCKRFDDNNKILKQIIKGHKMADKKDSSDPS